LPGLDLIKQQMMAFERFRFALQLRCLSPT
jgi:hypothetical protein